MNAKDIMRTDLVSVTPDHSVKHAAELMVHHAVSGLPVLDSDGRLVGLITEGDLLRRAELGTDPAASVSEGPADAEQFVKSNSWRVGDVMATELATVTEDTLVPTMAELMRRRGIKRLPVLRNGELVGIVSRRDLLGCIASHLPEAAIRGDDAIRRSVTARLRENALVLGTVPDVTVENGVVHLRGEVPTAAARKIAEIIVDQVQGVAGLVDERRG